MKKEIWITICAIFFVAALIVSFVIVSSEPVSSQTIAVYSSDVVSHGDIIASQTDTMQTVPTTAETQESSSPEETSASATEQTASEQTTTTTLPPRKVSAKEDMRAIWVPYMTLNKPTKEKLDSIVDTAEKYGCNAIMLHVRPFCDALYDSDLFPTSHLLTGTQGDKMTLDVLGYVIEKAHAKDIEVHAWLNPLRIQLRNSTPKTLAENNPYNVWRNDSNAENDNWVVDYSKGKYFNPAYPEVREYIVNGIREIVRKYDVDGIHWDDYFYPASDESFDDSAAYNKYTSEGGKKSLKDWRKENINKLVKDSYSAVKTLKSNVVFGISPGGNMGNCRNAGADIDTWCSENGYVDYICPQIYWSFDHSTAPFDKICRNWRKLVTNKNIKFYVGLALYKAGSDDDKGTWQGSNDILAREVRFAGSDEIHADGFMIYSYDYLKKDQTKEEVKNLMTALKERD